MTEGGVIGGVGGSGTELVLLVLLLLARLLLRYEGGGPRLSRRIGGLPCPAGRIGGGRAVLVRTDVVTKRSARALLTVVGGRGERTVHLLRLERTAHSSADWHHHRLVRERRLCRRRGWTALSLRGGCGCGSLLVRTLPARVGGLVRSGHRCVEGGEFAHHHFILLLLIGMHGLGVLTQIVESRKLLTAVTSERPFASMFATKRDQE